MSEFDPLQFEDEGPRGRRHRWFARYIKYPFEAAVFFSFMWVMERLPVDRASAVGAWIAGTFGPKVSHNKRALRNLHLIYPEMPQKLCLQITRDMWREIGATAAEYPHLGTITDPENGRVEVHGFNAIKAYLDAGTPVIIASGHFSNFEVMQVMMARLLKQVTAVVRDPNNSLIEEKLEQLRSVGGGRRVSKGKTSVKQLVQALEEGDSLGILVDQKLSKGVEARFLGYPAMTPTAVASFALRYHRPIFCAHLHRTEGARFVIDLEGPLLPDLEAPREKEILRLTQLVNDRLGAYILEHPSSWLWLHRRWPRNVYEKADV